VKRAVLACERKLREKERERDVEREREREREREKKQKNQSFFWFVAEKDKVRTRDALANDLGVLVDPHVRRHGGALAGR
jgi:hypothetical protein